MYPRLNLGGFSVSSYLALYALAAVVSAITALRLAQQSRLRAAPILALFGGCLLAGLLGSHCLHVCVNWASYQDRPWEVLYFWKGRAFLGGPIFGLVFVVWFVWQYRLPAWKVLDVLAPALVIAQFFGRLGCCAAGCCHGYPTSCALGVSFFSKSVQPPEWRGVPLHPAQLYEAAGFFLLFYALLWLWQRRRFDGQVGLAYFLVTPVLRFVVEFFRGDAARGFVLNGALSTSQFVSIVLFTGALAALTLRYRALRAGHDGTARSSPSAWGPAPRRAA